MIQFITHSNNRYGYVDSARLPMGATKNEGSYRS